MRLENFISEMQSFRSINDKIQHLKRYNSEFFRELMDAAFNPMRHFNLSVRKSDISSTGSVDLSEIEHEVLELLSDCELCESPKQNREKLTEVINDLNAGSQELLKGIINKKLKCGAGQRVILKAFPGLYKPFNPQKGYLYNPNKDYGVPEWIATPKYNGIRCVALWKNGFWKLHTFVGHEIHTCSHLLPDLETIREQYGFTMIDGELYNHELSYNRIESAVLSSNNPESGRNADIHLYFFNIGYEDCFSNEIDKDFQPKIPYFAGSYVNSPDVKILTTKEQIYEFYKDSINKGFEGIVIRNPIKGYDFRKSNYMLKVKKDCFGDLDFSDCKVLDIVYDQFPFANPEGGYTHRETMVALIVEQPDGLTCRVGSGFTNDFREKVYHGEISLINKMVEVKHEGYGDQGRMIFPVLNRVRDPKDKI